MAFQVLAKINFMITAIMLTLKVKATQMNMTIVIALNRIHLQSRMIHALLDKIRKSLIQIEDQECFTVDKM